MRPLATVALVALPAICGVLLLAVVAMVWTGAVLVCDGLRRMHGGAE